MPPNISSENQAIFCQNCSKLVNSCSCVYDEEVRRLQYQISLHQYLTEENRRLEAIIEEQTERGRQLDEELLRLTKESKRLKKKKQFMFIVCNLLKILSTIVLIGFILCDT
jgi:superfamily I DNA and/or RNA helicase